MPTWSRSLVVFLTLSASTLTSSYPLDGSQPIRRRLSRAIVTDGQIAESYDFVIAGGGLAGLVLASRLSEDPRYTVLVLEAGKSGDEVMDHIQHPLNTYINSTMSIPGYNWAWQTVSQSSAGNRPITLPGGRVLGGSSATNGLYYTRPVKAEVDVWAELNSDDAEATKWWSYDTFLPALKRAESFAAPSEEIRQQANIHYQASSFGNDGPIHIGYPGRTFDVVGTWSNTLNNVGIPLNNDPGSGVNTGSFVANSAINPSNWTRSYSRSGYIDPLPPRSNLVILPEATVTRIVWSESSSTDSLIASAVEFSSSAEAERRTVKVNKEVIVTSGPIGTPKLLQLSGIGPKDVLSGAGVEVKLELPGVGAHFQDHVATPIMFATNTSTPQGAVKIEGTGSPELMSFVNSAIAYVNLKTLVGDFASTLQSNAAASYEQAAASLGNSDPTVLAGHKLLYETTINKFYPANVGAMELLLTMVAEGSLLVQAALQKSLSWGRVAINSTNAFDMPVIDPRYFAHENDRIIEREGAKLARRIGQTSPLRDLLGDEMNPAAKATTDEEWDAYLPGAINTEYHQSGSAAMLPRNYGGVVDPRLRVYGTANVRVADSSVFPFSFSCHLASPTYGLAEQAANIILTSYNTSSSTASGSSPTTSENPTSPGNGAMSLPTGLWTLSCLVSVLALTLF